MSTEKKNNEHTIEIVNVNLLLYVVDVLNIIPIIFFIINQLPKFDKFIKNTFSE